MEDIEALKKTFDRFLEDVKKIDEISNFRELDQLEIKLVRMLQLMEAEIGYTGRGLYDMIQARRMLIRQGKVKVTEEHEDDKLSDTGRTERQSDRKTKRTRKQR